MMTRAPDDQDEDGPLSDAPRWPYTIVGLGVILLILLVMRCAAII